MASPRISITYCTQCRWLLRATWMAQELLTTFSKEIGELALQPATGGVFQVRVEGALIWDRADQGGFPEITELKRMVRDRIAPDRNLGHIDRAGSPSSSADS
jgi:selenoprotein W-related protein